MPAPGWRLSSCAASISSDVSYAAAHRRGGRRRRLQAGAVAGPAGRVVGGERREAGRQRAGGVHARAARRRAEAERQREVLRGHAVERRGGGLAHVPALAGVERRVERAVVAQVEPRLAGAGVAARGGAQRGLRGQRARDPAVAGHEVAPDRAGAVVAAVVVELRVEQHVQAIGLAGERLEATIDEHRRPRGVGRVRLGQPPAPGAVGHRLAVVEAVQPLDHADAVHRLAVDAHRRAGPADRELHVADARGPEVGVVDLGHLAVAEREPGPARARRRRAEGVLVGLRPRRLAARRLGCGGARTGGGSGEQERCDREHGDKAHERLATP